MKKKVEALKETCSSFQRLEIEDKKRSVLVRELKFWRGRSLRPDHKQRRWVFWASRWETFFVNYQKLGGLKDNNDGSKASIKVLHAFMDLIRIWPCLRSWEAESEGLGSPRYQNSARLWEFKQFYEVEFRIRTSSPATQTRVVQRSANATPEC